MSQISGNNPRSPSSLPRVAPGSLPGGAEPGAVRGPHAPAASGAFGITNLERNPQAQAALQAAQAGMAANLADGGKVNIDRELAKQVNLDLSINGERLVNAMSPEQKAHFQGVVGAFTAQAAKKSNPTELTNKWTNFIGGAGKGAKNLDVNALVQLVLREAYMQNSKDLQLFAEKVQFLNEQKKQIREYTTQLRDYETGLNDFLRQKGWTEPPKDPAELKKYMDACAEYYDTHKHPIAGYSEAQAAAAKTASAALASLSGLIDDAALKQSADEVANRAAKLYEEKFGCPLPEELKTAMKGMLKAAMGPPEVPEKLNDALEFFAAFVSYSSDTSTKDGKFGTGGGYDDVQHLKGTGPNMEDFAYYLGADAEKYISFADLPADMKTKCEAAKAEAVAKGDPNKTARGNLAAGDARLIESAFGMDANTLHSMDVAGIVNEAMTRTNVTWKNDIIFGQKATTEQVMADIKANGLASPYAESIFGKLGVDGKAQLNSIRQFLASGPQGGDLAEQAREALGLPDTVPPGDAKTPDQIEGVLKNLEEQLQTLGDDSQVANLDLQNMLEKQQQTLQLMSGISKMLSDTAMAVIRKIGG